MAIKIIKNTIDIPFEDENGKVLYTISFDRTDEAVKEFPKKMQKFEEARKNLSDDDEEAKKLMAEMLDEIFGKGTFATMYKHNPSLQIIAVYLMEIAKVINETIYEELENTLVSKYN